MIKETSLAKPGSIIIAHMNQPSHDTAEGLAVALPKLRDKGLQFAKASELGIG